MIQPFSQAGSFVLWRVNFIVRSQRLFLLIHSNLKLTEMTLCGSCDVSQFNRAVEMNAAGRDDIKSNVICHVQQPAGRLRTHLGRCLHFTLCACKKINKQINSCLGLRLFTRFFNYFFFKCPLCAFCTLHQPVSVTATASVSTRVCVRSARTWQPADTARAASPASTEIRPTGAAASVSIRGAAQSCTKSPSQSSCTQLHLTCQCFTVQVYVGHFLDSWVHSKSAPWDIKDLLRSLANTDSQSFRQAINRPGPSTA